MKNNNGNSVKDVGEINWPAQTESPPPIVKRKPIIFPQIHKKIAKNKDKQRWQKWSLKFRKSKVKPVNPRPQTASGLSIRSKTSSGSSYIFYEDRSLPPAPGRLSLWLRRVSSCFSWNFLGLIRFLKFHRFFHNFIIFFQRTAETLLPTTACTTADSTMP